MTNVLWSNIRTYILAEGTRNQSSPSTPTEYHEGHGPMPFPDEPNTCWLVGWLSPTIMGHILNHWCINQVGPTTPRDLRYSGGDELIIVLLCSPEVLLQLQLLPPGQPRLQLASLGRRATVNIVGTVVSFEMKSVPVCFGWMDTD